MSHPYAKGASLKQLVGLLVLVIILGIMLAWWIWSVTEKRALFRQIAAYRAAGEPVWPTDFVTTPIPADKNAAIELHLAAQNLESEGEAWIAFDRLQNPP